MGADTWVTSPTALCLTQVYVDLAGWHLYSRDMSASPTMKMSQALALQLGPKVRAVLGRRPALRARRATPPSSLPRLQAQRERLRESDIESDLKKIQVKAGAGKLKVSK